MKAYFIGEPEFSKFVESLVRSVRVVAPVAKKSKFVFDELTSASDLRLDYDVTILPPKKAMFPVKQELVHFNGSQIKSAIAPVPQVLLGVHFYDVKAIDMLDELFRDGHTDWNYLANREQTTIIASNVQKVSSRAFFASVGQHVQPVGHDAYLTKVAGGYVFECLTAKGAALVKHGAFSEATAAHLNAAKSVNEKALTECPEHLDGSSELIAKKVREAFKNKELWNELSEKCFSCGTCNIVCPTCYCFDVQDEWNLDQVSGSRCRSWDGCLLEDFAKVSLGGGHCENFREHRADRFRHRVMRKTTYLNDKLGGPACVGCGRCSVGCVPDIADPVKIVNKIVDGADYPNVFLPREAEIMRAEQTTANEKHFTLQMKDGAGMDFAPGQIVELSVHGYGEIPIGFASSPTRKNTFDLVVRTVGRVSSAVNKLKKGDSLFVRGPLGHGFDLDKLKGHPILIIAGGIGLCPTRSLIQYVLDRRTEFKSFKLFFGSRTPKDQLFLDDLAQWRKSSDVEYLETVDKADESWKGNIGVITTLFQKTNVTPDTRVIVCGPPVMYKFVIRELDKIGIPHENVFVDLERRMKCGLGKCGHCQMNDKYVCYDGPVFSFKDIENLEEAFT